EEEPDAAHGEVDADHGHDDDEEVDRVGEESGDDPGALALQPPGHRRGGHAHGRSLGSGSTGPPAVDPLGGVASGPSAPPRPNSRSRSREIARSAFML